MCVDMYRIWLQACAFFKGVVGKICLSAEKLLNTFYFVGHVQELEDKMTI